MAETLRALRDPGVTLLHFRSSNFNQLGEREFRYSTFIFQEGSRVPLLHFKGEFLVLSPGHF